MKISIAMILDRIKYNCFFTLTQDDCLSTKVSTVELLYQELTSYANDVLYLIDIQPESFHPNKNFYPNVIYLHNNQSSLVRKDQIQNNRIVIYSDSPSNEILNEVYSAFLFYKSFFDEMVLAFAENNALQKITDLAAECLENPVFVYDPDVHVLAYSKTYTIENNEMVNQTITHKFIDIKGNLTHALEQNIEACKLNNRAFVFEHPDLDYRNITKTIIVNNRYSGFMHVPEALKRLTRGMLDTVESISYLVSIELQRNYLLRSNSGIITEQFIIDLLENKITTRNILTQRISTLNWKFFDNIYVLCICPMTDYMTNAQLAKILNSLIGIIKNSKGIIYKDNLVMILNCDIEHPFDPNSTETVLSFLKKNNLNAGLSLRSTTLIETHKLYSQALRAIKLGMKTLPEKHLYFFCDYLTDAFFDACFQSDDISEYCQPTLIKLINYDLKHQTRFVETLRQFITHQNSQIKTASHLHIHRSTLLYRLQKIEEIMNIQLNNMDTIFHLQLSFKLTEYMEKYH